VGLVIEHQIYPIIIHEDGTIIGPRGNPLKGSPNSKGYLRISVPAGPYKQKRLFVHHLVCEAFHGPRPEGMKVAHTNGNQLDNRADNLRWATDSENQNDRKGHGTVGKLTKEKADEIRVRRAAGEKPGRLATEYGVSYYAVWDVCNGRTWD
jgi:hypothetical protein